MLKDYKFPDALREELGQAVILYQVLEHDATLDAQLSGANRALSDLVAAGSDKLWIKDKKQYHITPLGRMCWANWKARWGDFLINYDMFTGVDLLEGRFATAASDLEEKDEQGHYIWEDLRVATCIRRLQCNKDKKTALSPLSLVFLQNLSEGRLDNSDHWQFDIAYNSIFWTDIENVVNTQIWPQELGYDDVPWEKVMDDILLQGTEHGRSNSNHSATAGPVSSLPQTEQEVVSLYSTDLKISKIDPAILLCKPNWTLKSEAQPANAIGNCWTLF